jgi:hypothetical protein
METAHQAFSALSIRMIGVRISVVSARTITLQ